MLVPIAHDSGYYWGRRGLLKKPGVITVVIGKPISAEGRDVRELNQEIQEWMEECDRGDQALGKSVTMPMADAAAMTVPVAAVFDDCLGDA